LDETRFLKEVEKIIQCDETIFLRKKSSTAMKLFSLRSGKNHAIG
jgi:hypothetical protein